MDTCLFNKACRGRKFDWGAEVADSDEPDAGPTDGAFIRKIPIEADLLMAYSVVPGQYFFFHFRYPDSPIYFAMFAYSYANEAESQTPNLRFHCAWFGLRFGESTDSRWKEMLYPNQCTTIYDIFQVISHGEIMWMVHGLYKE